MKKVSIVVLALIAPCVAMAENKKTETFIPDYTYMGLRLSKSMGTRLKTDGVYNDKNYGHSRWAYPLGYGLILGNRFNDNMRLELELDYMTADAEALKRNETDKFRSAAVLGNFYWNGAEYFKAVPYLGIGVGVVGSSVKYDLPGGSNYSGSDPAFAYQFSTGLEFILNEYVNVDLGFRWRNFGTVRARDDLGDNHYTRANAWQFYAGMAYKW
ncbi:MAG: outer membrane beta-barrel protein [Alphaproteobacteria bacterium]|nr:outer membrane beta-barrel protein [Alphaproteobacteria bacterium]